MQSEALPGSQPLSGWALWLAFASASAGAFMINLDGSVVNVALPTLSHRFDVPVTTLQWVISAYYLVISGLIPISSWMAGSFGRREVFFGGVFSFGVGSLICALAPSFSALVAARCIQGIGASVIMSNVPALVASIFPISRRGEGMGFVGMVVAVGTMLGPALGGVLTAVWGWRSIFWVNLPVTLGVLWGVWHYLPRFLPQRPAGGWNFDWWGAVYFVGFSTTLQLGLINWHAPWGWGLLAVSVLAMAAFLADQKKSPNPLVPLRLFRYAGLKKGFAVGLIYWVFMMFPAFLAPLYLQSVLGLPVGLVGLVMVSQAVAMTVMSPFGGRMVDRYGARLPARVGMGLFAAAGVGFMMLSRHASILLVVIFLAMVGAGAGCLNSSCNVMVLNVVPGSDIGAASGLTGMQRAFGRSTGVAMATVMLSVAWMLMGIGPVLSLHHPHYVHWFLAGLRVSFGASALIGVVGWLLIPESPRMHGPSEA